MSPTANQNESLQKTTDLAKEGEARATAKRSAESSPLPPSPSQNVDPNHETLRQLLDKLQELKDENEKLEKGNKSLELSAAVIKEIQTAVYNQNDLEVIEETIKSLRQLEYAGKS